jgi:type II secretory ATPase GspE/PulE/Tfp pilus assembly ATPase PilB-like protein
MGTDIILEFSDKRSLESKLARPFNPKDGAIYVFLPGFEKIEKFSLTELCCILMKYNKEKMFERLDNKVQEEVTTFFNKTYHVYVAEESFKTGFFSLLVESNAPYRLIFFCIKGVKVRCQKRLTGEILESQKAISLDSIQVAIVEQRRLKQLILGETIAEQAHFPRSVIDEAIEKAKQSGAIQQGAKVGEILVALGLLTQDQVDKSLSIQQKGKKKKLGELLIEERFINEDQLIAALASKFRIQMIDLSKIAPDMKAIVALSSHIVRQFNVMPIADIGEHLIVVISDPTDHSMKKQLRFITGRRIEMVAATSKQIADAIEKYYPPEGFNGNDLIHELSADHEVDPEIVDDDDSDSYRFSETDSKIVHIVNRILMDAYHQKASDIHFEPSIRNNPMKVRYRIDGECRLIHQIPHLYKRAIISRLKIIANLDITERRKPQSGKILLNFQKNIVEYRIETTPTTGKNEDAVLRILVASETLPLNQMGLSPSNLKAFQAALSQPYGIILCVGPTGAGKTTTLHSALAELNKPEKKIWTVEDPVEIIQDGIRQVQINSSIGLNFAEVLRSFLRLDPDIIMIGEMRDAETAKIAIEASLTGHLVLSTLHTNSAPETIVRLIDMDMDPFNFSDALLLIVAQRLARKLCDQCKKPYTPSEEEYMTLVGYMENVCLRNTECNRIPVMFNS